MSAVKQAFVSIGAVVGRRKSLPRSTLASTAVVGSWLLFNLAAYGALVVPDNSEESLLARRSVQASAVGRVESLPNTPFFGRAPVKAATQQPEVDLANIPITQLNLVLSGVLDNSAKDKASALVSEKGKPAQRVYIGDSLPGGAELYSVAVDHIVLQRNGKMEKLTYPDEDGRPSVPMRQIANYARQAVEASASSAASRSEKQQSIRERLEELRELARERRAARTD